MLEAELVAEAQRRVGPDAARLVRLAAQQRGSRLEAGAASDGPGYLKHALRVALITLQWAERPTSDTLALAILHNLYEVAGSDEQALTDAGFSPQVIAGIRALTIDRARDEDEGYLRAFYAAIERAGTDVVLVRCADKIDNLLGHDIRGGERRQVSYVDLSERFVLPMALRLSEPLGRFFASVVDRTRRGW